MSTSYRTNLWTPILWGGLVGAAVNFICCCCCCTHWLPGLIAGFLVAREAQKQGFDVDASQGALAGLGAGLIAATSGFVFGSIGEVFSSGGGLPFEPPRDPNVPPAVQEMVDRLIEFARRQQDMSLPLRLIWGFLRQFAMGAGLGALFGVIGVMIFRKPAGTPPATPPPSWTPPVPPPPPPMVPPAEPPGWSGGSDQSSSGAPSN